MDFKPVLVDFIAAELLDGVQVDVDEGLLVDGMVDSLGMMRLVAHIEALCGIDVPVDDFVIENFRSVAAIDDYLRRTGAQAIDAPGAR
ncbi:MAG: D-alanine--poly(phosphoribitol) ligase subunit 2 [Candidatus Accumulibacter appositus]|uniref:D-alanine--poly(Phosphoribitol) ligase subunit 2 n=1 Tax=Candidatus Accumulibacter appositus TaxID=1454003 RepID=A0A011N6S0_9PROT|nr:phosphopantetheine-binding protein [Accumulibacter sp.]EXI78298.1 MAG: D-alanine--poly(phosphoribitol) ligase subunit 2 [Candidatus Accumulibacter appositus]HRF04083.1 phosphopantetheine-binding protein [Accumulibacter sp.]